MARDAPTELYGQVGAAMGDFKCGDGYSEVIHSGHKMGTNAKRPATHQRVASWHLVPRNRGLIDRTVSTECSG